MFDHVVSAKDYYVAVFRRANAPLGKPKYGFWDVYFSVLWVVASVKASECVTPKIMEYAGLSGLVTVNTGMGIMMLIMVFPWAAWLIWCEHCALRKARESKIAY